MNYRVDKLVNQWFNKKRGYGTMAVLKKKTLIIKEKRIPTVTHSPRVQTNENPLHIPHPL